MKCSIPLAVLFTSTTITAIPLLPRVPLPQSYSVVPVDGGTSAIPATKTVTSVITSLATIIVTQSESDAVSTIIVPQTITTTDTIIAGPPFPWMTQGGPKPTTTVTLSESVSSSAYDNGQWHTTYYAKSTALIPVAAASSSRQAASTPTETMSPSESRGADSTGAGPWAAATSSAVSDPGSWQAWSDRGNNGMWNEGS